MSNKKISIGLFGFGCVGQGLYDVLNETKGIRADIVKICVRDRNKKRRLPAHHFTYNRDEILNNPAIDVVVELIDDADAAFEIVTTAMKNGKGVVTANKKMVAEHFDELFRLQQECGVPLLYESSCCASIPVIRNLEEYYDNDLLSSVEGIFNGSSNYILTKVCQVGRSYDEALKEAQALGFAETDPTLDVGGFDAKYKLCIITAHAFGVFLKPEQVFNYGIQSLSEEDIRYAREKDYKIKLVAHSRKLNGNLCAWVLPQFITKGHKLYHVDDEYNGVLVEGAFSDKQFFVGKGAGSYPTGSAVLSDISALTYQYKYEYKKHYQDLDIVKTDDVVFEIYLRFKDEKVLSDIQFESIGEKYQGKDYGYVTGRVKLFDLITSPVLFNPEVFIAQTPNEAVELQKGRYDSGRKTIKQVLTV